ncbi:plasmid partitioning protein RepB C-terminal domain-containing protein [Magnetospirillum sp. SS-4]|uniref:plasmid partitioning protein RepB C-terminal domain-containing protein n=1 Tax=Magnetospirillum sp. SS-4 TaxID=2681465 RepID=UPI0013841446|nr:plasmid partitioning protein RepB C-terminal domain-containing protein [Magnetospirillum sp. SS-4]CAA7615177.1 Plasmid partitioning protein [Magnetospirillum sp. SS-4]
MSEDAQQIHMIAVDSIKVLNPRVRNKRIFQELVTSIAHLGLKKPITVSLRGDGSGYDLVCGQGRLEAFVALGQSKIPAVVIQASRDDCFVMSLVENLARRHHTPLELLREIGSLKDRGYSIGDIAAKTDFSSEYIYALCYLLEHGEKRLLAAIERGVMPYSIAMEIAKAKDADVQQALAEAYEAKALPGNQLVAIRRIIEQRNLSGKRMQMTGGNRSRKQVTADALVRAYRKETERQKLLVKKAALIQSRLIFVVNALRRLLADDHFVTLLRAESMNTMPRPLQERLGGAGG